MRCASVCLRHCTDMCDSLPSKGSYGIQNWRNNFCENSYNIIYCGKRSKLSNKNSDPARNKDRSTFKLILYLPQNYQSLNFI